LDKARKEIFVKAYLLTLLTTSLIVALIGYLTPEGERGGLSKHISLLSGLCLFCVLIAPLGDALTEIRSVLDGNLILPWEDSKIETDSLYRDQLQSAMDEAGDAYFTEMLTQTLELEFAITPGEVRCVAFWERKEENPKLQKVTVLLSGSAIWRDTAAIEAFVSDLLGCPCTSAIE
jgi:hypothetical protein